MLPEYAFFNGEIRPYQDCKLGLLTHALNYGTACFGGIRGYWSEDEEQVFRVLMKWEASNPPHSRL